MRYNNIDRQRRKGLTLLELVIVIAILAVVAMAALTRFAGVDKDAELAMDANNAADIQRTLGIYYSTHDSEYPTGFDSLLDASSGDFYSGDDPRKDYNKGLWHHLKFDLYVDSINGNESGSLGRIGVGTVYDHDPTASDPSFSTDNATPRSVRSDGGNFAFVSPWAQDRDGTQRVGEISDLYRRLNLPAPGTKIEEQDDGSGGTVEVTVPDPDNPERFRVVALGVGTHCGLIGADGGGLDEAPFCAETGAEYYGRFIALFKVHSVGRDQGGSLYGSLLGVMSPRGKTIGEIRTSLRKE